MDRGAQAADVTGWWLAFLVLTIAAERLELSRLLSPPRSSQLTFAIAVALIIAGAARGEFAGDAAPFSGAGLLASTAWLVRHDIALRTIRLSAQPRFSAACLLAGYFWLGVAGLLLLVIPPGTTVFSYDAAVHAITIGFVLSMIFGHAPIILPAVTGFSHPIQCRRLSTAFPSAPYGVASDRSRPVRVYGNTRCQRSRHDRRARKLCRHTRYSVTKAVTWLATASTAFRPESSEIALRQYGNHDPYCAANNHCADRSRPRTPGH